MSLPTDYDIVPFAFEEPAIKVRLEMTYFFGATEGEVNAHLISADGDIHRTIKVHIPSEIYANWTTDDNYLINYVFTELGITLQ